MRKHKPDIVIALIALGLILAGTIVIFAVGPRVAETKGAPSNTYILHHLPMVAGDDFYDDFYGAGLAEFGSKIIA